MLVKLPFPFYLEGGGFTEWLRLGEVFPEEGWDICFKFLIACLFGHGKFFPVAYGLRSIVVAEGAFGTLVMFGGCLHWCCLAGCLFNDVLHWFVTRLAPTLVLVVRAGHVGSL